MSEGVDESGVVGERDPAEVDRIYKMSDWQANGLEWLETLADARDTFSFRLANGYTHGTLWCLVRLDHELTAQPPNKLLIEPAARLHSLLPFSDEELSGLAARMEAHEVPKSVDSSDEWFLQSATDEDILFVERWRRWLDRNFSDETIEDHSTDGHRMIAVLKEMDPVLADIV
jgi:hypothetical protein